MQHKKTYELETSLIFFEAITVIQDCYGDDLGLRQDLKMRFKRWRSEGRRVSDQFKKEISEKINDIADPIEMHDQGIEYVTALILEISEFKTNESIQELVNQAKRIKLNEQNMLMK